MNDFDKMVLATKARTTWVLVELEERGSNTIHLTKALKTPYSRVISVGPLVPKEVCKVGDRVIFREGIALNNSKEPKLTDGSFLFVHMNNILGVFTEENYGDTRERWRPD